MQVQLSPRPRMVAIAQLALIWLSPCSAFCQFGSGDSDSGYIDDAIVGTQFRARLDAAYDNALPDRAEFFYAKCGCFRELGVDRDAPGPPELETGVDYQDITAEFEYAFTPCFSTLVEAPFRFLDPEQNENTAGFADLQAGFKYALLATSYDYFTFQFRTYFPTGEAIRGLGTDHVSLEPGLLYHGKLTEQIAVDAELRDWIAVDPSSGAGTPFPDEDFGGNVLRYGIGMSCDLYYDECSGQAYTPVVEVVGWTVLDGLASGSLDGVNPFFVDASGDTIVNIKVGARIAFTHQDSLYVGYGRALTDDVWYEDIARFEYRWTF
jgi:hypothetical protein